MAFNPPGPAGCLAPAGVGDLGEVHRLIGEGLRGHEGLADALPPVIVQGLDSCVGWVAEVKKRLGS